MGLAYLALAGAIAWAMGPPIAGPTDATQRSTRFSRIVSGNAPHKGGEEEGVICVNPYSPGMVEAAIFSRGKITVFATAEKYEYLSLCVKDWITQVNSGHRDRMTQPKNVSVVRAG